MSDRLLFPSSPSAAPAVLSRPASPPGILLPVLLACGAFLLLHGRSLVGPVIFFDDFQILSQSRTWQRTCDGLWVPQNEHAMPLGRLLCFALEWLAGRLPMLPLLTCLVGPLALLLALGMSYVFVRREMGHPFYALLVVVLFAVTSVYHQAVWWFAASFAVLSLDMMLLGLLAVQRWRQTGRGLYLDLAVLACLLAPGWFALGIFAGPLCCLYLLPRGSIRSAALDAVAVGRHRSVFGHQPAAHGGGDSAHLSLWRRDGRGSVRSADRPAIHGAIAGGQSAAGSRRRGRRRLADLVHRGDSARSHRRGSRLVAAGARSPADAAGIGTDRRHLPALLQRAARWSYGYMVNPCFARYHLLPQLGLALFFCGGLPGRAGRWFTLDAMGALTADQRRLVFWLIGVCFVVNLPRGMLCGSATGWAMFAEVRAQQAALRRIEEVDARCRQYRISAAAARQALGRLDVPLSMDVMDGWEFLIGSDDPQPLPPEEIERLLEAP